MGNLNVGTFFLVCLSMVLYKRLSEYARITKERILLMCTKTGVCLEGACCLEWLALSGSSAYFLFYPSVLSCKYIQKLEIA